MEDRDPLQKGWQIYPEDRDPSQRRWQVHTMSIREYSGSTPGGLPASILMIVPASLVEDGESTLPQQSSSNLAHASLPGHKLYHPCWQWHTEILRPALDSTQSMQEVRPGAEKKEPAI